MIDAGIGEQLRALSRDNPERLAEFVLVFVASMGGRIACLQDAAAGGDLAVVASMADRIHNGSAFVGARRLAEACARLADRGPALATQGIGDLVQRVVDEYDRVETALKGLLADGGPAAAG